jgi:hypothetical protein
MFVHLPLHKHATRTVSPPYRSPGYFKCWMCGRQYVGERARVCACARACLELGADTGGGQVAAEIQLPQIVGFWFERNMQHCFYAIHTNSTPQKYKAKMEALEAVEACGVKERVCERTASVVWEYAAPQVSVSVLLCE